MKKLNILFAASLLALGAQAEVLSPAQALQRLSADGPARRMAARALQAEPMITVANHSQDAELYVFAPADGGLMVVSAESNAPALLGYSENFVAGEDMPPALEMMLEAYAREIEQIRAAGIKAAPASRANDFDYVPTICETYWGQGAPFNESLPKFNGGAPYVGCAGTAMAQILKVHEYPEQCTGSISYGWNGTTLTGDFSNYKPDWKNMLIKYNGSKDPAENRQAVADLMKACGYSCKTNFTTTSSGASGGEVANGFINIFGYDYTVVMLNQVWFSLDEWNKMIYGEVAAGRPVHYSGYNNKGGGHGFVIDGYKGDGLFHVNWGWTGTSDGYFLLSVLDPKVQGIGGSSDGYSMNMSAIIGIQPGQNTPITDVPVHMWVDGGFKAVQNSTVPGGMVNFQISGSNGRAINRCPITFNGVGSALKFVSDADGKEYYAHCDGSNVSNVKPLYGMQFAPVIMPNDLPEGTYKCYPAVWYKASDKIYPIHYSVAEEENFVIPVTVMEGKIYLGSVDSGELKITDVDMPKEIRTNVPFYVKGNIENPSSVDFEGSICLGIYEPGKSIRKSNLGEVCSKASGKYTTEFDAKVELTLATLVSGNYDLAFYDAATNKILSDRYEVVLIAPDDAATIKASKLTCLSKTRENLQFEFDVTATSGDFKGQVYVEIREKGQTSSSYVERYQSDPIQIPAKETKTITVGDEFKDGEFGKSYTAYIMYRHAGEMVEAPGTQRHTFVLDEETSIDEISADKGAEPIYDLSGRRVANPVKGNIYISNNRKFKL